MAENKAYKYRQEISQMMYVSGETAEPPVETTSIIEDIVRQQVIELVRSSSPLLILIPLPSVSSH
jgi:transcription initiation protein SPT3